MQRYLEKSSRVWVVNILSCIVLLLTSYPIQASTESESAKAQTFRAPIELEIKPPIYPQPHRKLRKEGWVSLAYMINPQGATYDITVVDSSNDTRFEYAAIEAAKKWRYSPATLDGEAIDAGVNMNITFARNGPLGPQRNFTNAQKRLFDHMGQDNRKKAGEALDQLRSRDRSIYEEAYLHLTEFFYRLRWGSPQQQYESIARAVYVDDDNEYLPIQTLTTALSEKFHLEIRLNMLAQSLLTAERLLKRKIAEKTRQEILQTVKQISIFANAGESFEVNGAITGNYRFTHQLFRPAFGFSNVSGVLAEIRLHCNKAYLEFVYDEGLQYKVPEHLAQCLVTVIGDPGTQFQLVEY